jgi:putative transposase
MNLEIGPYVVMPNHFHAIISIGRNKYNNFTPQNNLPITTAAPPLHPSHKVTVPVTKNKTTPKTNQHPCRKVTVPVTKNQTTPQTNQHPCRTVTVPVTIPPCPKSTHSYTFGNQSKNLAAIIGGFKSAVTRKAKLIDANFAWQRRYHDHLIRDQKSFDNISNYIKANIKNWKADRFS